MPQKRKRFLHFSQENSKFSTKQPILELLFEKLRLIQ